MSLGYPGFPDIETIGQKNAELIYDSKRRQGEDIELYPIVEENKMAKKRVVRWLNSKKKQ